MMRDDIPVPSRTDQFTLKRMYFWLKVGYMMIFVVILGGPLLCMHQRASESVVHKTLLIPPGCLSEPLLGWASGPGRWRIQRTSHTGNSANFTCRIMDRTAPIAPA